MNSVRFFPLDGAQRLDPNVERWFADPNNRFRGVARQWFDEMRSCGEDVTELLHDGHPTACVDGIALGYVNAFSSHVNVGFFLGAALDDPAKLLKGTGKFMRHVKVQPGASLNEVALKAMIASAYADLKSRVAVHKPTLNRRSPSAA